MTTQTTEQEEMYYLDDEMNNEQCSYKESFVKMNSKRKDEWGDNKRNRQDERKQQRNLKRNWEN
jgi:hypothetical protein